jgi:AcrR family transcriptional regulator
LRTVVDVKKPGGTRRYNSVLREEGARHTRQAIVEAAAGLFVTHGYAATSLADIAAAAGVARPTVFAAFGSKAAVLRQALDQALAGDDEPVPVADRPWFRPVWQADTPALVLDAYAAVCTVIGARAAPIIEAVRRAAHADAEAARLWSTAQENRRAGAEMVIERVRQRGPLRTGLRTGRAVDLLWVLNDPAHYHTLVTDCGWSEKSFTNWLAAEMRRNLLPPHPATRTRAAHGHDGTSAA